MLPDATIGATTIGHLQGQALPLGSVTIPRVGLPATNAGHVVGGQPI